MVKKILKNKELSLLILFATIIPITSIALTYGAFKTSRKVETLSKGIVGDTVYIDDSDSDYYYYTGQNYTSNNGTIPTAIDKNIYNDSNLVRTTITYNGSNKDGTKTGYVSLDELQSKYIYYKYYPVVDNYIEIPLIDNPFSYRPDDMVFNGWISDYKGKIITHRVVDIKGTSGNYRFTTKGIANPDNDPEVEGKQVYGIVVKKLVILSFFSHILNNAYGLYFLIILPIAFLIFLEILDKIKEVESQLPTI